MSKAGRYFIPLLLLASVFYLFNGIEANEASAYDECSYYYEALIDADNNEATGGEVIVEQQGGARTIRGIDYKARIDLTFPDVLEGQVSTISGPVLRNLQIWEWYIPDLSSSGKAIMAPPVPSFQVKSTYDYPIPLGIGNGVSSGDVIEFYAPKSDLNNLQKPLKVVFHASSYDSGFSDYTWPPIVFGGLMSIPTMTQWGMIILGCAFFVVALWMFRRQKTAAGILMLVLFLLVVTGSAWAPPPPVEKIILDGEIDDWNAASNVQRINDSSFDSSTGDPGEEIIAGFLTEDEVIVTGVQTANSVANNLYFRIDVKGGPLPNCDPK